MFNGAYNVIITVLQYVYTWLILRFCKRSRPTGTFGNPVPRTKRRAQVVAGDVLVPSGKGDGTAIVLRRLVGTGGELECDECVSQPCAATRCVWHACTRAEGRRVCEIVSPGRLPR